MTEPTEIFEGPAPASLRLAVLGASRGIGALTVSCALERGHRVSALARDLSALDGPADALTRIEGDARDEGVLDRALGGCDAVIYAIGTPGDARGPFGGAVTLHSEATKALLARMSAAGPKRLIAVTGYGAGESARAMSRPERMAHRLLLGRPYADKDRQEALILASGLDWTIARPVILRDGPGRGAVRDRREPRAWRNGLIGRADVAAWLVARAEDGGALREAPVLSW